MAYYRIAKDTPTGRKLSEIFKRCDGVRDRLREFLLSVDATGSVLHRAYLRGCSGVRLKDPDRKLWKYVDKKENLYVPKVAAKELKERYGAIGSVERREVDEAIGNGSWMTNQCGFSMTEDGEQYLIALNLKPRQKFGEIDPTSDCIEILSAEYEALRGDDE